jgi:hypothetical protein
VGDIFKTLGLYPKDDIHDLNIRALVEGNTFELWLPEAKTDPTRMTSWKH